MADERKNFTCFVCKQLVKGNYSKLTGHFRHIHNFGNTANRVRKDLICGQNGCDAKLSTFSSFRHHLMTCERVPEIRIRRAETQVIADVEVLAEAQVVNPVPLNIVEEDGYNIVNQVDNIVVPVNAIAQMFLNLRTR